LFSFDVYKHRSNEHELSNKHNQAALLVDTRSYSMFGFVIDVSVYHLPVADAWYTQDAFFRFCFKFHIYLFLKSRKNAQNESNL